MFDFYFFQGPFFSLECPSELLRGGNQNLQTLAFLLQFDIERIIHWRIAPFPRPCSADCDVSGPSIAQNDLHLGIDVWCIEIWAEKRLHLFAHDDHDVGRGCGVPGSVCIGRLWLRPHVDVTKPCRACQWGIFFDTNMFLHCFWIIICVDVCFKFWHGLVFQHVWSRLCHCVITTVLASGFVLPRTLPHQIHRQSLF